MSISINPLTSVITIPTAYLTYISVGLYELDVNQFRLDLKALEDDEQYITFTKTHKHNTQVLLGGVTYARIVEIIEPYTITFEDGQYAVNFTGANNNIADVTNVNQVSVRPNNSAGLVVVRYDELINLIKQSKEGNISYEYVRASEENATRKVAVGVLDSVIIKFKNDEDEDWSNPIDTKTMYVWYNNLGDVKPLYIKESE